MKYPARLLVGVFLALMGVILVQTVASAADDETITDAQLVEIRTHCGEIQATLNRIHANDALLRVSRGQLYEYISTKLMAPLNSRIALNRLDGGSLISLANTYEKHLTNFRSAYQSYEVSLSETTKTNCKSQPSRFYDLLEQTRKKRTVVFNNTQELTNDVNAYKQAFDAFAAPYMETRQ